MAGVATGFRKFAEYCEKMKLSMMNPADLGKRIGAYGVSATQKRISSNIPPANSPLTKAFKRGSGTLRDTGALHNSITSKTGQHWVAWGSGLSYSLINNEGGVITPKHGKYLAIPAGWETRKLMRKYGDTANRCIGGMKSAGYSVWKSKTGKSLLASKGKGAPFVLFILKESVTIPKRQFIDFDEGDKTNVLDMVVSWIDRI